MSRGKKTSRSGILDAAQELFAERGTAVTMDEIAEAAGVGRRTLFRHFATKGELIAEAMTLGWRAWTERAEAASRADSLDTVLADLLVRAQILNDRAGRGFWELASGLATDPELEQAAKLRSQHRQMYVPKVARDLWRAAGGTGRTPRWVVDSYALLESVHALHALRHDFDRSPREVGELSVHIMSAVLETAVAESRPPG